MSRKSPLAIVAVSLSVFAGAASAQTIWQIGKIDRDYHDLAFQADLNTYPKAFPHSVDFALGEDEAQRFSAIHPGPSDAWAGRAPHAFTIRFDLAEAPQGMYALTVALADTHSGQPPTIEVVVNEEKAELELDAGTGDLTLMHPEKGKPRTLRFIFGAATLKQGANRIVVNNKLGSWLLYDGIMLSQLSDADQPELEVIIKPSMFFVERDGKLLQEFNASVNGIAGGDRVKVEVRNGDELVGSGSLGHPQLGVVSGPVHIEPADALRTLTVTVSTGKQEGSATVAQQLQKRWRVFCAPSTHTDIGYTDIQDKVIALHNRNTDLAIELAAEFPLYHWNLESSWAAQMWLRDRPHYRHHELYQAARDGRIGIESGYLNMLTGLCSDEELIRNLYYSARLHRTHGVPFASNTLTDAPSHVWSVPTILAGAGIRYLSCGINGVRAPFLPKGELHNKSPFWWEGPDGSRILAWFTGGYSQAGHIGLKDGIDRMRVQAESFIYRFQHRDDYPYDAILLHGAYSDNVAIGRDIAESITAYSQRYAYPKIELCSNDAFFKYIEENFADELPTYRGCGGSWWEDGAGSSAVETQTCRVTHQDIIAAEAVWAAVLGTAEAEGFPGYLFNRTWDNLLLYDEHTWGAYNSMTNPTSDFVHRQFAVKAAYANDARAAVKRLLDGGLRRLSTQVDGEPGDLLVFNPSGQTRTGLVEADIPKGMTIMDGGQAVPLQTIREDVLDTRTVLFLARDVPAVGYKLFQVVSEAGQLLAPPSRFDGKVLENDYYRVTFDATTGGVAGIVDKRLGKQVVDASSPYKLGQVIYAVGGEFDNGHYRIWGPNIEKTTFSSPKDAQVQAAAHGPVYSSVKTPAKLAGFKTVELETILYEHEPRIDFVMRLDKEMTYNREALYIAFPIAGGDPQFRYEIGAGNVRPNEDHLPGGCRDWFAVQRWVTVNTGDLAVAFSPIDTPLITLCEMTPGKWLDELPITNGTIFAYPINNYWFTNYKAGQDGWFTFRYAMTSGKSFDPGSATLFGESACQPMRAMRLHGKRPRAKLPPQHSFCRVEPADHVTVTTVKRADDGKGLIVRLRETAGHDADVKLHVDFAGASKASRCDLVERVTGSLPINDGVIETKLGKYALTTVRIE